MSGCRLLQWLVCAVILNFCKSKGILYPKDSESRVTKDLDGMWNFKADFSPSRNQSFQDQWYLKPLSEAGGILQMPVPSSYNDITTDKSLRDFVGWVWYDREFFLPKDWEHQRVILRFSSVHYHAIVYINGHEVFSHEGGHLPFEGQINSAVNFNGPNRVTVAVNNVLSSTTLPPGSVTHQHDTKRFPAGYVVQNLQMDFFNYAGIHRHVHLYTTPQTYVDDITIVTTLQGTEGLVEFRVSTGGTSTVPASSIHVAVQDRGGKQIGQQSGQLHGTITVPNARLWWPYTMQSNDFGYLYTLVVNISGDIYRQKFGIRTVKATDSKILINNKPFYCLGVAKHEDSDIRGKGLDYALIARDFQMLKWLGSNCFRTSHYPYAEEILDQADVQGIVVIDESPGVGISKVENFGNVSLNHHKNVMTELVQRDKNRPSVIMWSVANEPDSGLSDAEPYFRDVITHTRNADIANRPITFACSTGSGSDKVSQFVDVISINRYYGWYSDTGHTEVIALHLANEFDGWRTKHPTKPILVTEYGADTVAGLHEEPSFVFTEEYQTEFMAEYHHVFDKYRSKYLVGEMVWNFADFMTGQGVTRVVGNRKGILTRQRQPKAAGHLLRARYHSLLNIAVPGSIPAIAG